MKRRREAELLAEAERVTKRPRPATHNPAGPGGLTVHSVNTQGYKSDVITSLVNRISAEPHPSMAVIQEAGAGGNWDLTPSPDDPDVHLGEFRTGSRGNSVHIALQLADATRNGQMILSNRPFRKVSQSQAGVVKRGVRPAFIAETEDAVVGSVHQPSGKKKFAAAQTRDQAVEMLNRSNMTGKPGALVGDFNATPKELRTKLATGTIVSSGRATHQSGGSLDHAVLFNADGNFEAGTLMAGDHAHQTLLLRPKQLKTKRKAKKTT